MPKEDGPRRGSPEPESRRPSSESAELAPVRELVLVKLGGSLITEKTQEETPRLEVMSRLAEELAATLPQLRSRGIGVLLGHGSGSYGHVAAKRHGYREVAAGERRRTGAGAIHNRAETLHCMLVTALVRAEIECLSLAPSTFLVARDGAPVECWSRTVEMALHGGLVPVVYGDVVLDESVGYSICSTETVLSALLERLREAGFSMQSAVWLGETDGILDAEGRTLTTIRSGGGPPREGETLAALGEAAGADVTGGIRHRFETVSRLAEEGVRSLLVNGLRAGAFSAALQGDAISGTVVEPMNR